MEMRIADFDAFERVVRARRSVRVFEPEPIPEEVLGRCLDLALLAPNSQNLHPWEFVHVADPTKLAALRVLCLDQTPARNAPTLLVLAARPDQWRRARQLNLDHYTNAGGPDWALEKYRRTVPLIFEEGPFHVLAPIKALVLDLLGLFRPTWRGPFGFWGLQLWATKTTALACENLMLALCAAGYDSCPMEGFDEPRVKRLVGLPGEARVVMVLAVGRRAAGGAIPQVRFDRALFVRTV